MSSTKSNFGRWVAFTVLVLAIGAGLGWKAVQTFNADAALKAQYNQVTAWTSPPRSYDSWALGSVSPEERARNEELSRLQSKIYASGESAELWMSLFVGFICLVAAVLAMYATMVFLARLIRRVEEGLATGPSPIRDGIAGQIGLAKTAISKGLPRQPTTGLGRLSTADELRKWATMRDEGLVTEDEFQRMREKLVGKS